jgi:hypothetical protein
MSDLSWETDFMECVRMLGKRSRCDAMNFSQGTFSRDICKEDEVSWRRRCFVQVTN